MSKFFLSFLFVCASTVLWSQNIQEKLEQRKAQIQKEIKENEKQLQFVNTKEKSAENSIVNQTTKIKLKELLINVTEKQSKLLSNDMYINQMQVNKLNRELLLLKEDYTQMIIKSYKSRSEESRAMFLLSSQSFLQAYKRAQYMKQYTNFRKIQGQEIQQKSNQLTGYYNKLTIQKTAKQQLINENEKERLSLEIEKQVQQKLVESLKKDKNKIAEGIKKKHKESKAIDKKIDTLIRAAIAEANRKAAQEKAALQKAKMEAIAKAAAIERTAALHKKAAIDKANALALATAKANSKPIPKPIPIPKAVVETIEKTPAKAIIAATAISSTKIALTPGGQIDADNFRANKGKLPWPVEKGFISLDYGDQSHPVYKALVIHNSGLEITTDQGSSARAVFAGVISSVIILSPINKLVMIQHGDFFTVYQNLSSVLVNKGDKVSLKQSLGRIRTNGDGKTILKFTISQNTSYTNPKMWLSAK